MRNGFGIFALVPVGVGLLGDEKHEAVLVSGCLLGLLAALLG